MAREIGTAEMSLVIDSEGQYAIGIDPDAAKASYEEDVQPLADCEGFRVIRITVRVPLPEVVEMVGEAPDQGEATLTVADA